MDETNRSIDNGFVAIRGTEIAALGPMNECPSAATAEVMDCADCVILPGLINAHTHLAMSYFRGLADDLPLAEWLEQHIWPAESKHLSPQFVYEATLFAAAECIRSGVTCVNDMYIFAADAARAIIDAGLRGYVGEGVIGFPTASAPNWQDGRRLTEELIAQYDNHPLITPTVCVHAPYSCDVELLQSMHQVAQEQRLLYQIHLHESFDEAERISWAEPEETPTHSMKRIGVLGPRMVAVHCVWVDDHDIRHLKEFDCGVGHCPASSMKLGNGIAPVHSMVEADLPVGLGTDGAASNNNISMWEEIHLAALAAKSAYKSPKVVPAEVALSFATSNAAALLHDDSIGVLAVGKHADIAILELGAIHLKPRYHHEKALYSHLVYCAQTADVRDTIVAGKVLMRNRQLTQLDEEELKAKAQEWVDRNF